jgi:hypothetical protein
MERTLIIDFVAIIGKRNTILALLIWLMLALALWFNFFQVRLKALMLHEFVILWETVDALLMRGMVAWLLYFLHVLLGDSEAVDALRFRSMIAVRLFDFLVCFWLIRLLFNQARLMIAHIMILLNLHLFFLALLWLFLNAGHRS